MTTFDPRDHSHIRDTTPLSKPKEAEKPSTRPPPLPPRPKFHKEVTKTKSTFSSTPKDAPAVGGKKYTYRVKAKEPNTVNIHPGPPSPPIPAKRNPTSKNISAISSISSKNMPKLPSSPRPPKPVIAKQKPKQPTYPRPQKPITSSSGATRAASSHPTRKMPDKVTIPDGVKFKVVETLTDEFVKRNKEVVAKEKAELVNTVELVIKQLNGKIAYLESLNDPKLQPEIETLKAKRNLYQTRQELGESWASTNAPRFAFQELGKEKARQEFMPVLGDLWIHSVQDAQNKTVSSVSRSAAVTDFSHGRVSLQELQDYHLLMQFAGGKRSSTEQEKEMLALYLNPPPKTLPINGKILKNLKKVISQIKARAIEDYGDQIATNDKSLNLKEVEKIIADRSEKLSDQVLQDLFVHFQTNPVKGNEVVYGRTGLVDPKKKADVAPTGFVNNEHTQALDMAAIYNKINGRPIIFDIQNDTLGPYIDKEGRIHMPKSFYQGKEPSKPVTLHSIYLNISAQGHTKNEGVQKAINERALRTLENLKKKELINKIEYDALIQKLENSDKDPFEAIQQAIHIFSKAGYASVDCFGGKDRTGYALALTTHEYLKKIANKDQGLLDTWGHQLLSEKGLAARIIKYSTGYLTMKLRAFGLKLYNTKTLKGTGKRIADYFKGARIALGPKVVPTLAGRGQLYAPWTNPPPE